MFTFLKAQGKPVGNSLVDDSLLEDSKKILEQAREHNTRIIFPIDYQIGKTFNGPFSYIHSTEIPEQIYKFFIVCVSSIVRKVANADPKISKPFISKYMRMAIERGDRNLNTYKYLNDALLDYSKRIIDYTRNIKQIQFYICKK